MAITFPRDLPSPLDIARCRFHHEPIGALSRAASGAVAFQEQVGGALWEAFYATPALAQDRFGLWHAFYLSLRQGVNAFKGYDPQRPYPLAYGAGYSALTRAGGGAFDGTCNVTAAGGGTIALSNLPANYVVTVGDYISFSWRGAQALVTALETVTGNGSGIVSAFAIAPWRLAGGTVPATATLVKAWCTMKPKPGTWSGERTTAPGDPISFEAIQAT